MGKGMGIGQQAEGAAQVAVLRYVGYETEMARIVGEIGLTGLLGVVICRLSISLTLWNSLARVRRQPTSLDHFRKVSLVAIGIAFVSNTAFNHVPCAFTWIIAA